MTADMQLTVSIRSFLAATQNGECFTSQEIAQAIDADPVTTHAKLAHLRSIGVVNSQVIQKKTYWMKGYAFVARHIIPLFMGSPEWVVEAAAGDLICWCPSEFKARLIADALCRS